MDVDEGDVTPKWVTVTHSQFDNGNHLLSTSISPGHLFPLYHGCHCPILDLNAGLLYHSIPSLLLYTSLDALCARCAVQLVPFHSLSCC